MTQRKITHDERLRHVEAVRRVAAVALLPLDPRAQRNAREVLDFVCAHVEELPEGAGRMAVPMAADYVHRGTLLALGTIRAALGNLERLGLIVAVQRPARGRGTTTWSIPTGLCEQAASLPPATTNFWVTEEGRAYRHAGAAFTAEQAAADRAARLRREAARSLRRRDAAVTDETIAAEITRTSSGSSVGSLSGSPVGSSVGSSSGSSAPKNGDTTSLRSAAVGSADGLSASGTAALAPRSDGEGDDAGTPNDATTTGPRQAVAAGPGRPAENDAQRRADTPGGAAALSPVVAEFRRRQGLATTTTTEGNRR